MAEKEDLAKLQDDLNRLARDAMDAMRHMAELDATGLKHCGYGGKTNADAVLGTFQYHRKRMDAAIAAHISKYPD